MRGFLVAAETGSFSAAARKLGFTQPTLSRQVAALEQALGLTLFERIGNRLTLTETGLDLFHHGRAMTEAADTLALAATGRAESVSGLVSISASDGIATYLLPPMVKRLREVAPQITIELISSNQLSDLRRREADIAIRHVRPEEPDLIGKFLRDGLGHFYASEEWIAEHGKPNIAEDVQEATFIGFDRTDRFPDHLRGLGIAVRDESFSVLSENSVAGLQMIRQGLGIGVMMAEIADQMPDLVRVLGTLEKLTFPIWLVTHRELHTSRRIRLVFDFFADELTRPPSGASSA